MKAISGELIYSRALSGRQRGLRRLHGAVVAVVVVLDRRRCRRRADL